MGLITAAISKIAARRHNNKIRNQTDFLLRILINTLLTQPRPVPGVSEVLNKEALISSGLDSWKETSTTNKIQRGNRSFILKRPVVETVGGQFGGK